MKVVVYRNRTHQRMYHIVLNMSDSTSLCSHAPHRYEQGEEIYVTEVPDYKMGLCKKCLKALNARIRVE